MALTTPGGHGLGVRFAPPDPRSFPYPHARALLVGAPQDIDLRARMQPVGDQGQLGSCTGWAGTAALEAKLGDGEQRSPLYVYYYDRQEDGTPASSDAGATMLGLCKALKDFGAPLETRWPYSPFSFSREPDQGARDAAKKIDAYYQIQGTGMPLLQGIWAALEAGEPVPIALYVYPSFERTGRDGKVPMVLSGEQVLGGHAICACGWFNDNSAPGGYGWVMAQNSWSTSFGDQGYVYLPSAYFTSGIVQEGWVLSVTAPPPPPPEPHVDDRTQRMKELTIQARELVLQAQQDRCAYGATKAAYQQSMAQIMDHDIGPIMDVMNQLDALIDEEPAPPEPPVPGAAYQGFAVTYAGHDPARDCYLGTSPDQKEWGRHDGLPVLAPAPGRVELYQFPTPLNLPGGTAVAWRAEYQQNHDDLFGDGWVCMAPFSSRTTAGSLVGAQAMFVAVYWPDAPIRLANGQMLRAAWFGHCKSDVPVGRVDTGGRICTSYDSGIRFENNGIAARAAHVHTCGSATGTLSPNGDVDGLLVAQALGWQVEYRGASGPGPQDYMAGNYIAGKPRSQWGGHQIPPLPS